MKHRLVYLAAILTIFITVFASLALIGHARAASTNPCAPLEVGCSLPTPDNPSGNTDVKKDCPASRYPTYFPSTTNPNLQGTYNSFIECEQLWAKRQAPPAYVPGAFEGGEGTGSADYCHRNFTGNYLKSCKKGYADGKGADCGKDSVCEVGAYARVQLDASGQNNSTNNPASDQARSYCEGKNGVDHRACIAGYNGQSSGKNKDDACHSFNGKALNICKDAWDKAKADASAGSGDDTTTCEKGSFSFNWVLCPIFNGVSDVTSWVFDSLIQPLLMTDPICLDPSGNKCDNTIFSIWSGFRVYGDIFLIIALLVIVFGESIGGGLIDAYTAKKILPRLLVAAVLINLSIYIVTFLVDITNVVGGGIGQLLTFPLHNQGAFKIQPDGISQGAIGIFGASGLLIGGFALGVSGIALLLVGLIITGAIAMIGIFVTLIIRQSIITALILIAPVAFALWCLPNTANWFKRWWDLLFQMLLVYPMIVVIFAVADIMSYTTQHNGSNSTLSAIVSFMLLIIPLYLVPFTLRSSNRLLGQIHGAVSNVGRQINSATGRRAFGGAGTKVGQNMELMQTNRRFNPNNRYLGGVNKRMNTALSNITSPGVAAKIYGGSALRKLGVDNSMGKGILDQISAQKFQHTQKLGERLNQMGFNDRALRSLMQMDDYSAASIRQKAAELRTSENSNDRLAANQLDSGAAFLAQTLHRDAEMGRADIGMAAGLAVTAQGFSNSNEVADLANRRGGQGDGVASAFVTQAQLNGQRAGMLDMKAGYGVQVGKDGRFMGIGAEGKSVEERNRAIAHQIKRIQTTGQQEIQAAKGGSVEAMAPGFEQMLLAARGPANADGKYEFRYRNEQGQEEKLEFSPQEVQRVAAMLGTAQADYSGTSAGTNTAIQKIIDESGLSGDVLRAYQRGKRDIDASRMGAPSEPPQQEENQ